eukprot:comp17419_c0_seq1/m.16801 comp17419_c0_seq1/g.16801  ORF comp17419_c0_seq1/g.16801 comp17419_c0_seq1/m.16801 type:complete len:520 (-) comp17419_c0_seq1:238-1797(-)
MATAGSGGPMGSGPLKIGNYILGETLGVGSFGKVKLASHQHTGHKVAVKILNRKKIRSLDMVGKIKREIQNLKLFSHPHIIKLYEVISTPTDIFLVMEYVSGGELFEYIVKHGKLSEDAARKFFQQIICGVEYCHRHKVVHRDLKPENLLLDENKNVKIADFGLSNIMTDGDFLKTSCGSPNYAAPEVISGKLYAGPEVDVWSCGVILYALLCGKLPFDDEYIPNLFKKIKGGIFTLPGHLSEPSKEILTAMLQVDPLKRATIGWIREHPWFRQNLPRYLEPHVDHNAEGQLDEVVKKVCQKMNVEREELLEALHNGQDNDPLRIAYNLVLDNRRMRLLALESRGEKGEDLDAEQAMVSGSLPDESILGTSHEKGNLPRTTGQKPQPAAAPPAIDKNAAAAAAANKKKRSRWHLGIRSRSQPYEVMSEVYRAMRSLNFEWKVINPYHVNARMTHPETGRVMKVGLQLYKVDERHYLLDFKNLANPDDPAEPIPEGKGSVTMGFFELCAMLIRELAVTSG